jgi:hypothetical protein
MCPSGNGLTKRLRWERATPAAHSSFVSEECAIGWRAPAKMPRSG